MPLVPFENCVETLDAMPGFTGSAQLVSFAWEAHELRRHTSPEQCHEISLRLFYRASEVIFGVEDEGWGDRGMRIRQRALVSPYRLGIRIAMIRTCVVAWEAAADVGGAGEAVVRQQPTLDNGALPSMVV